MLEKKNQSTRIITEVSVEVLAGELKSWLTMLCFMKLQKITEYQEKFPN